MDDINILVVEDESIVAMEISERLKEFGYHVVGVAHSANKAMELTSAHKPDLILMDIMLRKDDGVELSKKILQKHDIPIIFLTAHSDHATLQRAKTVAPYGYLIKPFNDRELNITIEMALYRNETEKKIKRQEKLFSAILLNIHDAVIATDSKGKVLFLNPLAEKLTGWHNHEAKERFISEVCVMVNNKSNQKIDFNHCRNSGTLNHDLLDTDVVLRSKNGNEIPIEYSVSRIPEENEAMNGCVITFKDISQKKENALKLSRLASVVQQSNECMVITDVEGNITYVNQIFVILTGLSLKEIYTQNIKQFKTNKEDEAFYNKVWNEVNKNDLWKGEINHQNLQGNNLVFDAIFFPIKDDDNNIINIAGLLRDITREKELKKQLDHSDKLKAIGQLAGGIAHEFNNILQVINGHTELLMLKIDRTHPEYLRMSSIHKAGMRAKELTYKLLAFCKQQQFSPMDLDLNLVIYNIYNIISHIIGKDIQVDFLKRDDLPYINADPMQIEQIFINLVINARDSIYEKNDSDFLPKIIIKTNLVELSDKSPNLLIPVKPGKFISLSIEDNGNGMEQSVQQKIFEPFFSTKGLEKGTGLGLSTVYGIIEQNGGSISLNSRPQKGSCFTIYWPISEINQSLLTI